ncbi:hypothetical protein BH11BAC3_BH11BAC3_45150 [soil metagenome]
MFVFLAVSNTLMSQETIRQKFINEYISMFQKEYPGIERKNLIGKEVEQDKSYIKFKNKGLENVTVLIFNSKKKIHDNIQLGFKILLYHYSSTKYAVEKFKELENVKSTLDESIFGKDWNYVFTEGNLIFRLEAGCFYSENKWDELKLLFF